MLNPSDVSVVIAGGNESLANVVRTALKGAGVRESRIVLTPQDLLRAFGEIEPDAMISVVEAPEAQDKGLAMIRFARRYEKSPNRFIPIVAVSPRRDASTVRAVINSGGHEYAVFPASGDVLFKKVINSIFVGWAFVDHPSYVGPCRRRRNNPDFAGPERRANWVAPEPGRASREAMVDTMIKATPGSA
jgi:two-component system, chemotaxis family, chemotaxis protein CheY